MFTIISYVVFSSTFIAIALWFLLSGDYKKFTNAFNKKQPPKITELPIITATGQIVNSVEDLDMHLEFLKNQLEEKEKELEASKSKIASTEENLKRLTDTSNEVKKYYLKLKTEISRTVCDCHDLKSQIEDCKGRQNRLREEVNENVKYYTDMLTNIDNGTNPMNEDYEVVKKLPTIKSSSHIFNERFGII